MTALSEAFRKARDQAYSYLDYRARTRREMIDHLRKKGWTEEITTQVVADLERMNLVNDAAFAVNWLELRIKNKPLGRRAAAWELKKKGIGEAVIEAALEEEYSRVDELDLARQAAGKRLKPGTKPDEKEKRRIAGLLGRRGFPSHIIYEVLSEV